MDIETNENLSKALNFKVSSPCINYAYNKL